MYRLPLCRLLLAAILLVISWSAAAFAATVSIVQSGSSSYTVQGNEMNGVAGIQLDISYDAASLAIPTVTQGGLVSGAMLAANTSIPGLIKIAIISSNSFSGSGQIATIVFASKKASAPLPTLSTPALIDKNGAPISYSAGNQSSDTIASTPNSTTNQPVQSPATTGTVTGAPPTYLGAVTIPIEQQQQPASPPAPASAAPAISGEQIPAKIAEQPQPSGNPATDAKPEETKQYVTYKGILDRFQQYTGSKSFSAVVALFDKKVSQTVRQEPAVLLSDGQSKAILTIGIPPGIGSSPNFAVNGGTLVSFKRDNQSKDRWIVEVLPKRGVLRASVTIIAGADEFEYPLTVAPPIKTALPLDERGWNRFLNEVGTTTAPLHDFNNDGVRDYIDEFIFVANYMAGTKAPTKPAAALKKTIK